MSAVAKVAAPIADSLPLSTADRHGQMFLVARAQRLPQRSCERGTRIRRHPSGQPVGGPPHSPRVVECRGLHENPPVVTARRTRLGLGLTVTRDIARSDTRQRRSQKTRKLLWTDHRDALAKTELRISSRGQNYNFLCNGLNRTKI